MPAQPDFHHVRAFLRQRSRPAFHALGRIHGQGGGTRARRREGGLRPSATLSLTRLGPRMAATKCAARWRSRRSSSTAASTGKAPSSTSTRRTSSPTCRRRSSISRTTRPRASAPRSTAAKNIQAAGYPPDIVSRARAPSLWGLYNTQFWEVTQCQWQKRLDPTYDTYVSGTGTYNYVSRLSVSDVGAQLAAFATTGDIQRPLITVAGTMDALLPIDHHARAYARKVAAVAESRRSRPAGVETTSISPPTGCTRCRTETTSRLSRTRSRAARTDRAARAARLRSARRAGRARRGVAARSVHPARRPNRRYACAAGTLRKAFRALKARGPRRASSPSGLAGRLPTAKRLPCELQGRRQC